MVSWVGDFLADSLCIRLQPQADAFSVCHRNIPGCCDHLDLSKGDTDIWGHRVLLGE